MVLDPQEAAQQAPEVTVDNSGKSMGTAYTICGYPGAGKTVASEILNDNLDCITIETGNIVRSSAVRDSGVDTISDLPNEDYVGDYSTYRREIDGGDYIAREVMHRLNNDDDFPRKPVVISGMRDTESPAAFDTYFETHRIAWMFTPFPLAAQRTHERGERTGQVKTKDELLSGLSTIEEMYSRMVREEEWGTGDLIEMSDAVVVNRGKLDDLTEALLAFVDGTNGIIATTSNRNR